MILRVLAVSMIGFTLAGCVSSSGLSGDVYSASEAKQVQSVTYGTIVHTRAVQIQSGDDSNAIGAIGGAVLGGFLGNTIGGGTGRSLATAAGAVAGGVAGQGVQGAMNKTQGVELEIRKERWQYHYGSAETGQHSVLRWSARGHCRQRQPGHRLSAIISLTMRPVAPHRIFQPRLFRRNKFVVTIRHLYFNIP